MEFVLRDNSANNHLYCNYSDETETKTNSTEANIEILRVFTLFARTRTRKNQNRNFVANKEITIEINH